MNFIYEEREPFCTIHGVGSICSEGHVFPGIAYMIECWQKAEATSYMSGLVDTDPRMVARVRAASTAILVLESGEEVAIVIVGSNSGLLEIDIQGPIESCAAECSVKQMEAVR